MTSKTPSPRRKPSSVTGMTVSAALAMCPSRHASSSLMPGSLGPNVEASAVAYVYLLRCADGSLYCGWTTDPERRLRQHNAGTASRYTKRRRPVEYALLKSAADRSAALREEARIKKLSRAEKLELLARAQA